MSTAVKNIASKNNAGIHSVAIVSRNESREALRTALELTDWLQRRQLQVALGEPILRTRNLRGIEPFQENADYDLVIVLGGDGTLMSVARTTRRGVPILGVNLGRLGFLTELTRSELYPCLVRVLAGEYEIEERSLFDVELRRPSGNTICYQAFNDAVIAKGALAQIIELRLLIDGRLVAHFRADGLIISTPNGSTAYNLSAGGPIVAPSLPVAVLTPICPHALSMRPIVVPDTGKIEIVLETQREEVFLSIDGREGSSIGYHDVVAITRAADPARLVRLRDRTFYDSLRQKLKWGGLE